MLEWCMHLVIVTSKAHVLAALGAGLAHGESCEWFDGYPNDVTHAVTNHLAMS